MFMRCKSRFSDRCGQSAAGRILFFGGHALLAVAVVCVTALVFGWVVQMAWNASLPALLNLPTISFWQAVALLILGRILTGRLHHHRPRCGGGRHGHHGHHGPDGKHGHHGRWGHHGFKSRFCAPHHDDSNHPPQGPDYAQWWWEEGESAYRAYRSRTANQTGGVISAPNQESSDDQTQDHH